jgi:hypothetical protein
MQANYGANEIQSLLQKVRIFNRAIGVYELFAITDGFDYAVKLSNGKILIKLEELQDDERDTMTPDRLAAIANRFVSSTAQAHQQQAPFQQSTNQQQTGFQQQATNQQQANQPKQPIRPLPPLQKKSNSGRTIGIIVCILVIIIAGLAILNKINHHSGNYDSGSYEQRVMTVEEMERADPPKFLDASGTYNQNFWGDMMKIHGTVTNNATVANYKDVIIEVIFYSGTMTELNRKSYTIFDYFPAHTTKQFELKIDRPSACKKLGWNAIGATPY